MTAARARSLADEAGFLVASAIKLVLAFSVLGLAANEIGQMVMTKVRVENAAAAAQAGAAAWARTTNLSEVRATAREALAESDPAAILTSVRVASRGVVRVQATESAETLVLRRVSFLRRYGVQTGDESETPGP